MIKRGNNKNSDKKISYNNYWTNSHFDRISIAIPAGDKDKIKAAAAAAGQSLNSYITGAVRNRMKKEGFNPDGDSGTTE